MKISPRRILVVDDVPDNVAVLFDFLRDHGFRVLVSESGRHALAELPRISPDLILLDVMMPELDGFETCRRLKADPDFAETPVFFMTALDEPVDKVRGLEAGAADYIAKPIFPAEVLARINVHLGLRDARRALEERNEHLDRAVQRQVAAERALQDSLDRAVLVADAAGRIQFITTAAGRLLDRHFPGHRGESLPPEVAAWLAGPGHGPLIVTHGGRALELACPPAGRAGASRLVYLAERALPPSPEMLKPLGLTPRETEILFWIAQGKTTPEIGIILGAASTTVKKHVGNLTAKLGVETRLAAALRAMELLGPPW